MLLIGSKALKYWSDQLGFQMHRKPGRDTDYIATMDQIKAFLVDLKPNAVRQIDENHLAAFKGPRDNPEIYEFEIAWPGSTAEELLNHFHGVDGAGLWVASLPALLGLKHSHRFKKDSPHFHKTMADWRFLRSKVAELQIGRTNITDDPFWGPWIKRREKETYTNSHPKLNVTKKDFFKESGQLKYSFDHDSIHLAVKHLEHPAYWYFKEDKAEVKCSRAKFDAQDHLTKLYSGLEETYVLALERSQIPFPGTDPKLSFDIAAAKICSSISSGWWRSWIYEHFHEWTALYDPNYVERFRAGLAAGVVKPFDPENPSY